MLDNRLRGRAIRVRLPANAEASRSALRITDRASALLEKRGGGAHVKVAATSPFRVRSFCVREGRTICAHSMLRNRRDRHSKLRRDVETVSARSAQMEVEYPDRHRSSSGFDRSHKLGDLSAGAEEIKAANPRPFLLSASWPLEVFTGADYE